METFLVDIQNLGWMWRAWSRGELLLCRLIGGWNVFPCENWRRSVLFSRIYPLLSDSTRRLNTKTSALMTLGTIAGVIATGILQNHCSLRRITFNWHIQIQTIPAHCWGRTSIRSLTHKYLMCSMSAGSMICHFRYVWVGKGTANCRISARLSSRRGTMR